MVAAPAAGAGLVWAEAISAIVAVNMITASHVAGARQRRRAVIG